MNGKIFVGNNLLTELYKRQTTPNRSTVYRMPLYQKLRVAAGVTSKQLGSWLNNSTQPDLRQAAACVQELGISLDQLCSYEDKPAH